MSSDKRSSDQFSEEETKRRAEEALRGAFKTPPIQGRKVPPAPAQRKEDGADEST